MVPSTIGIEIRTLVLLNPCHAIGRSKKFLPARLFVPLATNPNSAKNQAAEEFSFLNGLIVFDA